MSIITRAEFAIICQTTNAIINTNVSRNKIATVVNDKKLIDTENPLNKIFKKNSIALNKEKSAPVSKQKPIPAESFKEIIQKTVHDLGLDSETVDKVFTAPESAGQKRARQKQNEEDEEVVSWDQRKKIADALQAERKADVTQLQLEKMMGQLMPVDLVEAILKINIQDIFKTFESSCINLASIYCDVLAGGDREKLAEIVTKLRSELSRTITRIQQSAAQEIENAVENYADSRSRGEKK